MKKRSLIILFLIILIGLIILLSLSKKTSEISEEIVQNIVVSDQNITNDQIIISEIVSNEKGWIVIHAYDEDNPEEIIGYSPINKGSNRDIIVHINLSKTTPRLFAMLHFDKGEIGIFEFPGVDAPKKYENESIIMTIFNVEIPIQIKEIPTEPLPSIKEFTIEGDDSSLYPLSIEVNKGDIVKITFMVRSQGTYYGGLDFRSDIWGDTGKVGKGESTSVEFTAQETFQFKSYWPASNQLKATGTVKVI